MGKFPFRFRDLELQAILEKEITLPERMTEHDFLNDIRQNDNISLSVNPKWLSKQTLALLIDKELFKKWCTLKQLHWIIVFAIIGYTIWSAEPATLLFLLVYAILTVGFIHSLFIIIICILVGLMALLKIYIPESSFFVVTLIAGHVLNKATNEMVERSIVQNALNDWPTFWRYYSNEIIKMNPKLGNNEYSQLLEKYPDLTIARDA